MSSRARRGLIGVLVVALLLVAALSLPAFGGSRGHKATLASDAARALSLAQAADKRSKAAAALVPAVGPTGPAGVKGPSGSAGGNGPNGANGLNGGNGGNGTNGANGAKGSPGDDGDDGEDGQAIRLTIDEAHDQATTATPSDYAISGTSMFTQKAGEFLLLVATVDGTTGTDCTDSVSGLSVAVLVNGDEVISGFLPWNFFRFSPPPGPAIDFTREPMQNGILGPPAADTPRTVTVEVADNCGTADDWTVRGIHISVAGTG